MKTISLLLIMLFSALFLSAQTLLGLYKTAKVTLEPDPTYAQNVDWNTVFSSYNDTLYGKWKGSDKVLTILPDGTAIVSHAYKKYYTRFNSKGEFVEERVVRDQNGRGIKELAHIQGVLDNGLLFTGLDKMGTMLCLTPEGKVIKTLTLDYMASQVIPLPNNKLALVGWVIWKDKFREFVSIVDYETNEEKIIWDHFTKRTWGPGTHRFNYMYNFSGGGNVSFSTMPFTKVIGMNKPPVIAYVGGFLIITIPETGEIKRFDLNGRLLSTDKIDWASGFISVSEQQEIQLKALQTYKGLNNPVFATWASVEENLAAKNYFIDEMEKDLKSISMPIPLPFFSTLIKDSEENLLFFEFPKEKNANKFNVWILEDGGSFVASCSFTVSDYEMEIMGSKMVFHDGYIYALAEKKGSNGVPLRLVRFIVKP